MGALEELADRVRRTPSDAEAWSELAQGLMRNDDPRRAVEAALQGAELDPQEAAVWLTLGAVFHACGEDDRALFAYRRSAMQRDADGQGWRQLGELLLSRGDRWAARVALALSCEHSPNSKPAHLSLARANLELGLGPHALQAARRAYELGPQDPEVLETISQANEACGHSEEAVEALRAILEHGGRSADVLIRLARRLDQQGKPKEAAALLDENAEHHRQNSEYLRWQGRTRRRAGDVQGALAALRSAVRMHPDDASAQFELGVTLQALGQVEDARVSLQAATRIDPEASGAWKALAEVDLASGRREDATRALLKAASVAPEDSGVRRKLSELMGSELPAEAPSVPITTPGPPLSPSAIGDSSGIKDGIGALSSDLDLVGVPGLMQLLQQHEATGVLAIAIPDASVELEFEKGMIVDIKRSIPPEAMAAPTREVVAPSPRRSESTGSFDAEERVIRVLQDVVDVREGTAAFRPQERLSSKARPADQPVNPQFAVLEALRRLDEERSSEHLEPLADPSAPPG